MRVFVTIVLVLLVPALARAQQGSSPTAPQDGWAPPPLVEAPVVTDTPTQAPTQPQPQADVAPTPPPPGYVPGGKSAVPYPYSPYGQLMPQEPPGPEIGLMVSESAFGMLTAGASSLLAYYMMLKPMLSQSMGFSSAESTVGNVLFLFIFGSIPMAVAQTELGIANGSRYYESESWPAMLSGLAAQGGVIGLYYLTRGSFQDGGEAFLLIGTIVGVPLVEMAVINLTKQPRFGSARIGAMLTYDEGGGLQAGVPVPSPMPVQTAMGPGMGFGLTLLNGSF